MCESGCSKPDQPLGERKSRKREQTLPLHTICKFINEPGKCLDSNQCTGERYRYLSHGGLEIIEI